MSISFLTKTSISPVRSAIVKTLAKPGKTPIIQPSSDSILRSNVIKEYDLDNNILNSRAVSGAYGVTPRPLLSAPSGKPTSAKVVNVKPIIVPKNGFRTDINSRSIIRRPKTDTEPEPQLLLPAPRLPEGTSFPRTDISAESMREMRPVRAPEKTIIKSSEKKMTGESPKKQSIIKPSQKTLQKEKQIVKPEKETIIKQKEDTKIESQPLGYHPLRSSSTASNKIDADMAYNKASSGLGGEIYDSVSMKDIKSIYDKRIKAGDVAERIHAIRKILGSIAYANAKHIEHSNLSNLENWSRWLDIFNEKLDAPNKKGVIPPSKEGSTKKSIVKPTQSTSVKEKQPLNSEKLETTLSKKERSKSISQEGQKTSIKSSEKDQKGYKTDDTQINIRPRKTEENEIFTYTKRANGLETITDGEGNVIFIDKFDPTAEIKFYKGKYNKNDTTVTSVDRLYFEELLSDYYGNLGVRRSMRELDPERYKKIADKLEEETKKKARKAYIDSEKRKQKRLEEMQKDGKKFPEKMVSEMAIGKKEVGDVFDFQGWTVRVKRKEGGVYTIEGV